MLKFGVLVALASVAHVAGLITEPSKLLAQSSLTTEGQPNPPQAPSKPDITVPDEQVIVTLVFSTLIALNQANMTGNYAVFRELGAPGFQVANSSARLTDIFAPLRNRKLDLSPILLLKIQLLNKPEIDANGMLRVTGYFPTRPERVNFDLLYQLVQGQWRLFGIAANTSQNQQAATAPAGTQAAPAQAPRP